jgi:hypothetical protein
MDFEHSIVIAAPTEVVFGLYANIALWPVWDPETVDVHLPQGLNVGAEGWLKPRVGPKAKICIKAVCPGRSFTVEGRLPLCRMVFGHELASVDGKTTATHSVRFDGPLAFLFRRLVGAGINATLPASLAGLKRESEKRAQGR